MREPMYEIDLTRTDTYGPPADVVSLKAIPPADLVIALKVIRSIRDALQHPEHECLDAADQLARSYVSIWKAAENRAKRDKSNEKSALKKALVWKDIYLVRSDFLVYECKSPAEAEVFREGLKKEKAVPIAYQDWKTAHEVLGPAFEEELMAFIEKEFGGRCNCFSCTLARRLSGEDEEEASDDNDEDE